MVEVPQESLMRWTAAEVRRMIEAGTVENPERFKPIDGPILQKMSGNEPDVMVVTPGLRRAIRAEDVRLVVEVANTCEPPRGDSPQAHRRGLGRDAHARRARRVHPP